MVDCDTLVIGSGAGGLTAAVALARAGEKVLVVEQHYLPGGWCHSFHLEGYRFSPGVHYLGQLGPSGSLRRIYEGLGVAGDLTFFELNPNGYDHCDLAGVRFHYVKGREALADRLKSQFPGDAAGIDEYLFLVDNICHGLEALTDAHGFLDLVRLPYRTRYIARYGLRTLERILADRVRDPGARSVMAVQCGDHGLTPAQASFGLHAAVQGHYLNGAFYPRGGGAGIVRALSRALKRHGGVLKLQTRVESILIEGEGGKRRAVGVRLADGTEIRAGRVVSNADPGVTYGRLVGPEHLSPKIKKKLAATRWSPAAISLFLALDTDVTRFGFDSGNNWYCENLDHELTYRQLMDPSVLERSEFPGIFMSVTTLKDPTSFDGRHHTVEAFTFVPYEAFQRFVGTHPDGRPEEYERLKESLTAAFLRTIDRHVPGFSKHVVFKSMGTPITNDYFVASTHGAAYGTEKSLKQMGPFSFKLQSDIPGLYLCGASTLSHGIAGASQSGLALAAHLLRCRPSELLTEKGSELKTYPADDMSTWPESLVATRRRRGESGLRDSPEGAEAGSLPAP